jgi:hypothetical protein
MIKTLKPADGVTVLFPNSPHRPLSTDGEEVEVNSYWIRRMNDGDVTEVQTEPAKAAGSKK